MKNLKQKLIKKWGVANGLRFYRHLYRYGYHANDVKELHQIRCLGLSHDTMVVILNDGTCIGLD